ncbi:hypothetical protein L228DRAFT_239596 [Xylona heveae TC161]|uniref:Peptidase M48 domain-containing protein n=1 Tax=Xylona heveae (strain CBS 132557 / TC161) TaxID=1328760 RepID=A0A165G1L9_XYLHT|nr:hypothetical protein L228DRAFT_239596 [Xylona heveae TC161]KZF21635.1 hypothetical protein L228DRAFT_239596 [Xylona heveae TC161]
MKLGLGSKVPLLRSSQHTSILRHPQKQPPFLRNYVSPAHKISLTFKEAQQDFHLRNSQSPKHPSTILFTSPGRVGVQWKHNAFNTYQTRSISGFGFPGGPKYRRFGQESSSYGSTGHNVKNLLSNPTYRYSLGIVATLMVLFYVLNLEEVPVSGRRRFNVFSSETEEELGRQQYQQIMQQYQQQILPAWNPHTRMVRRVMERLIPATGLQSANWEVHVIDDPNQINAFVIPGGKVFVFSGLLPVCQDDDGLATVLGHEIAHNMAHHMAERMSQSIWMMVFMTLFTFLFQTPDFASRILLDLVYEKPGSRAQETEADYIGLMLMAQSCYNPDAAVGLWQRMQKAEKYAPPQFLSTHPSSHNRVGNIREWLPEAEQKASASDCSSTLGYAEDFKRAFNQVVW